MDKTKISEMALNVSIACACVGAALAFSTYALDSRIQHAIDQKGIKDSHVERYSEAQEELKENRLREDRFLRTTFRTLGLEEYNPSTEELEVRKSESLARAISLSQKYLEEDLYKQNIRLEPRQIQSYINPELTDRQKATIETIAKVHSERFDEVSESYFQGKYYWQELQHLTSGKLASELGECNNLISCLNAESSLNSALKALNIIDQRHQSSFSFEKALVNVTARALSKAMLNKSTDPKETPVIDYLASLESSTIEDQESQIARDLRIEIKNTSNQLAINRYK